ncbi:SapB/AmfS family lanthipeptide [Streptomyces sp. NPDC020965]
MALLDLQALETPEEEAFGETATGSQVSVILCGYSQVSLLICTP